MPWLLQASASPARADDGGLTATLLIVAPPGQIQRPLARQLVSGSAVRRIRARRIASRFSQRAVGPVRLRPGSLPAQDSGLMPEDQDLRVLGGIAPRQERQPAEHPGHKQAGKADEHERRA